MAEPVEITFPHVTTATEVGTQRVYLRETWTDEWEQVDFLHCENCKWTAAPEMPTATLRHRYGVGQREGELAFANVAKLADRTRWYVKIEFDTQPLGDFEDQLVWHGVIEVDADEIHGSADNVDRGIQYFQAYGLELLLRMSVITRCQWADVNDTYTIDRAIDFNASGIGNRNSVPEADGYHVFCSSLEAAATWSTAQIVTNLLQSQTLVDADGDRQIEWNIDTTPLPTWDRPVLRQEGHNVYDLLNQLISRERLMSWYLTVNALDEVVLTPFTFTSEDIDLPEDLDAEIPENPNQRRLLFEDSNEAEAVRTLTTTNSAHRVRCRGARRRTCFSVSFDDSNLAIGWPTSLEAEYEAGASGAGDYPSASEVAERQKRNADARGVDRLRGVYSRFVIPSNWDQKAGNGEGTGTKRPVSPDDDDLFGEDKYPNYPPELALLSTLPLLTGWNYENVSQAAAVDDGPWQEAPPLVVFQRPEDTSRWQVAESLAYVGEVEEDDAAANYAFSVKVEIPQPPLTQDHPGGEMSIELRVSGAAQHAIAYTDFSGQGEDVPLGEWDYRSMICTVAIEEDRYCEGSAQAEVIAAGEEVRELVIPLGDSYRQDYVVPDTVIGVNPEDGSLIRSDGGNIRDDRIFLEAIARLAAQWYARPRRSLTFNLKGRLNSALAIGDYVTSVRTAAEAVDSVITAIEVSSPVAKGNHRPTIPTIAYTTDFGNLDPLQL